MSGTGLDPRWGRASPLHDPRLLAHFTPRSTDILITTAPKAGTTWMQQILYQSRTGGDDCFASIYEQVPWLEHPRMHQSWQETLQQYEAMSDPRIFKTHCTYPQTPGIGTVRIVLSSRDPRDCCVSFYHHLMAMTPAARQASGIKLPTSFDEYFWHWLRFGAWYRNVQSWWPHFHDTRVLWLRYEDMRKDLSSALLDILHFLGWKLTAAQTRRVLHYSDFNWMKAHAEKFTRFAANDASLFRPGGFIRKGQSGDYRSLLSAAQQKCILDKAAAELPADCMAFLGLA